MKYDPISLCQALVRNPSLSGQEGVVMESVRSVMNDLGYDRVWQDALGNTIGVWRGKKGGSARRLLVDIHADTVAVTSPESWQHDPYGGELVEGKIFGRGACDIKGGLASAIIGIASLPLNAFSGEIWVAATVAEEMIEGAATRHVLEQMARSESQGGLPDYCIVVEPTQLKIGVAQKGRAGVRLGTLGVPAHTSRTELGVNAVYKMLPAIQAVREMPKREHPVLGREIFELVEIISAPFPGNSIVPDACRARVDCRLLVGETSESLVQRFQKAVPPEVEVDLWQVGVDLFTGERLETADFHAAWTISAEQPLVRAALWALESAGLPAETYVVPYCCNASVTTQAGVPTIVFGPGDIAQAHAVDEWITTDELSLASRVFTLLAGNLLGNL
jgi:putative selenium metabolism hydrolase